MSVINISLGGVFGGLVSSKKRTKGQSIVKKGEHLKDMLICFRDEKEDWRVFIKETMVKRIAKDPIKDRYLYAFQFTKIERGENSILKNIIYDLQRMILRTRLPIL
jgi:c-di-GMP-binding flagellar brake protein YcgR